MGITVSKGISPYKVSSGHTETGDVVVSGGTMWVLSGGSADTTTISSGGTMAIKSGGIADGTVVLGGGVEIISSGGIDLDATISSGGTIEFFGGIAAPYSSLAGSIIEVISGFFPGPAAFALGSVTVTLAGMTTIGTGALLKTLSGGTAIVSGTVKNSGTLFASGPGSLVEIVSGAMVSGGSARIGDGSVEIQGSSTENVSFLSTGTGGLVLDDPTAYGGKVAGFGGLNHTNSSQFIDLPDVIYSAGMVSGTYSGTATGGMLTVTSGGTANVVAKIAFTGHYITSNFHLEDDGSGHVKIVDPSATGPQSSIAYGAATTLGYLESSVLTGGFAVAGDGAASVALLGHYIAGSFVTTAGGHGGTLVTDVPQLGQQPLLTHPTHG